MTSRPLLLAGSFSLALLIAGAGLVGGYRVGAGLWPDAGFVRQFATGAARPEPVSPVVAPATGAERKILYYRNPMGAPDTSDVPKKDSMGMDYIPVYSDEAAPAASAGRKVLYYRNPMGLPDTSDVPRKDSMGMDYIPVYSDEAAPAASAGRKVLYYRNPMGLPDTSDVPKKDSMGMDYIPVYSDEAADDGNTIKVSLDRVQRAGVRSEPAEPRLLMRPIRAAGVVAVDERAWRMITLRADGFIEKLYVNTTGQKVKAGEPLFRFYSPDIVSALAGYRIAMITSGKKSGPEVDGALRKLINLGLSTKVIKSAESKARLATPIDWPSPVSGTIMEKMVIEGERAEAGRALFKIADLSHVWIIADIAEQDLGQVRTGAKVTVTLRAMPGEAITGDVTFIYPDINRETRTGRIRIELANPDNQLKPDMYADVTIDAGSGDAPRLSVPVEAVIDSGSQQIVLIDKGDGRFEPRAVKLGLRGDGYVEITEGLAAGDNVVTTANFLIDAESNLKAALKTFKAAPPAPAKQPAAKPFGPTAAAEVQP